MPVTTAASVRLSAWLNALSRGEVAIGDAANACESATGALSVAGRPWLEIISPLVGRRFRAALIGPGRPSGVSAPGARDAVACGDDTLLVLTDSWFVSHTGHTVPVLDVAHCRRELMAAVSEAIPLLEELGTVGDRSSADMAITATDAYWPPTMPARLRGDLEMARRILITVSVARTGASVPSSPSQEAALHHILRRLEDAALDVLAAASGA